mmetsp:Transcript_20291/g.42448  ORF Transcript_20291/g.42448 Transcript_20291/m.42448 type:complete len:303 (+) Transcript_20291:191-1099(+)
MYLSKSLTLSLFGAASTNVAAFVPSCLPRTSYAPPLNGYLDDLTNELHAEDDSPDVEAQSREANKMDKSLIDRAGPGSFKDFVDFNEFDGGDGQMGVAGDGNAGLEKMDNVPQIASRQMSAKNAWGTSTGYADELRDTGLDTARAQQLENWANQQEVRAKNQQLKQMAESFDNDESRDEENWRQLANFGVERTQEFDMEEEFGPVVVGDIEDVIELKTAAGKVATHDLHIRNPYMGFADFRAAFTSDTPMDWSVEPTEGALMQKEDTDFIVKFRPQGPGLIEGYLVIETEDFKKTWKVTGST